MNELDPSQKHDATFLFIRTDERVEGVEAKQHDIEIQFRDHTNEVAEKFREQNARIEYLITRMDNQVSKTGHENTKSIEALDKKMDNMHTQLFDKDTGLITQFKTTRDWQSNFNKVVIGCFVTVVAGIIVALFEHFK